MSPIDRKLGDIMAKHCLLLPQHALRIRQALQAMYKFGFSRGKIERCRRQKEKA